MTTEVPGLLSIMPGTKRALVEKEAEHFLAAALKDAEKEDIVLPPTRVRLIEEKSINQGLPSILCVDECLSSGMCKELRHAMDISPHLTFWNTSGRQDEDAKRFRDADTIEVKSKVFASLVWERIKHTVQNWAIEIGENEIEDPRWERELPGKWKATGVNDDFLFAKYPSGGHFAPHTDGRTIHDFNYRSFYSIIIYLNSVPLDEGAGTNFYPQEAVHSLFLDSSSQWTSDKSKVSHEIEANDGTCLIFSQELVHEGVPPNGHHSKYIIRSDIMFSRVPPICDSESDMKAYEMYRNGQEYAENGQLELGLPLMKKAMKLSSMELQQYL